MADALKKFDANGNPLGGANAASSSVSTSAKALTAPGVLNTGANGFLGSA